MHSSNLEISNAQNQIELIKQAIEDSNDPSLQLETLDDIQLILDVLEDPIFRNLIQIQDSIRELNGQIQQHPSILPGDFDIDISGDLIINVPPSSDIYDSEYRDEQRVPSAQISPRSPNSPVTKNLPYNMSSMHDDSMDSDGMLGYDDNMNDTMPNIHTTATLVKNSHENIIDYNTSGKESGDDEREVERPQSATSNSSKHASDLMASEWTQVQAIELVNDGTGLGFGIIGTKTGVIVKTILPGGVADRDARLLSGDHILQIGDVNLHYFQSEQVASVLRQSGTHVRLIVARPVDPMKVAKSADLSSAVVPSRFMADPNELQNYLAATGYSEIFGVGSTPSTPSLKNEKISFKEELEKVNLINLELPETERFTVELTKDFNGLGITIAGYVCEKEELSGIFVKSVSPGSAADLSGRIRVNDRIIEVDGQSLQGFSNHQAVDVLKQSGNVVKLCLERYLRGPKYEQLQQAIAANEIKPQTPNTPPPQIVPARMMGSTTPMSSSRRSSLTKYANTEDLSQELTASGRMQRKFIQARDSIENKPIIDRSFGQESSVDNEEDLINELAGTMQQHHIYHVQPTRKEPIIESLSTATVTKLHKYYVESKLTKDQEMMLIKKWKSILGVDSNIIVAQIRKFAASSGLGISLEGTVDVEGGREVRPHHYIRSILEEGPVGQNGLLRSGDELLEVNNQRLLGMNHMEVVSILKELPQDVRMVCRRGGPEVIAFTEENIIAGFHAENSGSKSVQSLLPSDRLVKAKSDGSLATGAGSGDGFSKMKSRSLEPLTGLAMWSSETQIIELIKGERGLGFSILDYQDPLDPNDTLIVIRSLVPGGVAQIDGRLIPGDRLLFVNDTRLENASLDQAVQALKGAPKGVVRIGVAKPLPMGGSNGNGNESFHEEIRSMKGPKPDIIQE